jgi:SAM-dependent methyltransferase
VGGLILDINTSGKDFKVPQIWYSIGMKNLLGGCCAFLGATYLIDVPIRRQIAANQARAYANQRGLPLLNIGAGTKGTAIFGSTLYGDVNCDLAGRKDCPHGTPGEVTYADAQNLKDFRDGEFGAVLASHILEHLPDPRRALQEWIRVSGGNVEALFIITPSWWAPHTWGHPGHLWYATDNAGGTKGGRMIRLRKTHSPVTKKLISLR